MTTRAAALLVALLAAPLLGCTARPSVAPTAAPTAAPAGPTPEALIYQAVVRDLQRWDSVRVFAHRAAAMLCRPGQPTDRTCWRPGGAPRAWRAAADDFAAQNAAPARLPAQVAAMLPAPVVEAAAYDATAPCTAPKFVELSALSFDADSTRAVVAYTLRVGKTQPPPGSRPAGCGLDEMVVRGIVRLPGDVWALSDVLARY